MKCLSIKFRISILFGIRCFIYQSVKPDNISIQWLQVEKGRYEVQKDTAYWVKTYSGSNTLQNSSCLAIYLSSHKPST